MSLQPEHLRGKRRQGVSAVGAPCYNYQNMDFKEKTDCSDCPCLNRDYEQGGSCNMGYDTDSEWTMDKNLIYCSNNCELEIIKYKGGSFVPSSKTKVVDIHPDNW